MTTPNEQLFDDFLQRAIDVFGMTRAEARILAADFAGEADQLTMADLIILFQDGTDLTLAERDIDRIFARRQDALERIRDRMFRTLERFTQDEGRFVSDAVGPAQDETQDNHVFSAAFIAVLFNKVLQRPIGDARETFDDLFKVLIARDRERIERSIARSLGYQRGVAFLTQALRKNFGDTAESFHILLHSMVSHARSITLDLAMASVGGKVRWVSVLDSRTSPICRSRSGRIYPAGSGPRPPAHARCRSTVVPYFDGKGEYEEPTYEEWLKKQTPDRVREILGQTKGQMFLEGTLSLDDMVTAQGRELTLKELSARRKSL